MMKKELLFALAAFIFTLAGCQTLVTTMVIDATSIPDRTYEVTVHETNPSYYAVLFDIPDDGKQVSLFYTYATDRVGRDVPGKYIDRFNTRIKGYRTVEISDREDGTIRGYLVISNLLGKLIHRTAGGERILVKIDDPNLYGPNRPIRN